LYIGNTLQEILLYAIFGCLRVRILRALRFQSKFVSIKDAVDRFLAEIALYATVVLLFFTSMIQFLESETLPFPFHTWLYYVWVTVATVGYGDITPHTVTGRFAAMGMIAFALISVPKVTNELIDKMSLQSVYMRAVYTPKSRNSKHIVICGDLSSTSLKDFFGELFHEDHENVDLSAVILLPQAPTVELILLMRDPQFFLSINYLEGSALVETDLRRAKAETAQAMFIMSNKFSGNSDEEDAKSILLNLSIKRYVAAFNRPSMLYCMQLIRPENRRHLAEDEVTGLKDNDLVVCLNEIKMGAMAKAVMYPGANTLLMNLVSSFSDDAIEFGEDEGPDDDGESKVSPRAWLE
jgi:potassium large conductance calcium-activated channel subfamily M alpha protein 1